MKTIIFTTAVPNTYSIEKSFTTLGIASNVKLVKYDTPGMDISRIAEQNKPDLIIYLGGCPPHPYGPDVDTLCRTNRVAPMVHICFDSADTPWWRWLEEYNKAGAFKLQVGIDGSFDSPIAKFGMVALTPIDPNMFAVPKWDIWRERTYPCGFLGSPVGVIRSTLLRYLVTRGLLNGIDVNFVSEIYAFKNWKHEMPYEDVCKFYGKCKLVFNLAGTGSGTKVHVKGRFVEAGMAGAIPIEPEDSPAKDWFKPRIDYLPWSNIGEAAEYIVDISNPTYPFMAERFYNKMMERHSGPVFWRRVLTRMGL